MASVSKPLRAILFLISLGTYGLTCYHIGALSGKISSTDTGWDSSSSDMPQPASLNNGEFRGKGHDRFVGRRHQNETIADLLRMTLETQPRHTDENYLPYKCGMVFFYHVPSTGGSTINKWLLKFSTEDNGNYSYFTHWGSGKSGGKDKVEKTFIRGMHSHVQNIAPDEWRIAHAHINSVNLNASDTLLHQWRSQVESQGCHFVAALMLRDPLSHTLSLFKHQSKCGCSRGEWIDHLATKSELGHWSSQLDFFLYNKLTRNPGGVESMQKVRRALELLQNHFDIVTVGEHDKFKKALLRITGWKDTKMVRMNTFHSELHFTKKEVETMQKLIKQNGDTDFIDAVKLLYQNSFSFW